MLNQAKLLLSLCLLLALIPSQAHALKISEATHPTITGTEYVPVGKAGDATAYSVLISKIVEFAQTGLTTACNTAGTRAACSLAFGYSDPRWYGSKCDGSQVDDAGIQAAINSNYPVKIPSPYCVIGGPTSLQANRDGTTIYGAASGQSYNSNYENAPFIKVLNYFATQRATNNNCVFDMNGYDNVTIQGLSFKGEYDLEGTVAMCNKYNAGSGVGVRAPRAAAFLHVQDVAVLNMGNGIGSPMTSFEDFGSGNTCVPTGTIGANTMQLTLDNFSVIGACMGIYGNISDVHADNLFFANIYHNAIASFNNFAASQDYTNVRIEYTGAGANGTLFNDGAGMFIGSNFGSFGGLGANLTNVVFDHVRGPSLVVGPGASHVHATNVHSIDSWYGNNAATVNKCHFALQGATDVQFTNVSAMQNAVTTPYVLCDGGIPTFTAAISGTTMTVSVAPGATNLLHIGQAVSCSTCADGTYITALGTGGGGTGTYTVSKSQTVASTATFYMANSHVTWNSQDNVSGTFAGYGTSYLNLAKPIQDFDLILGGTKAITATPLTISKLMGYTEQPYDIGNSGTSKTIDLVNGTFQKITATGNATITMPAVTEGKSFTVRYYTGAGSFTATFTGVKWAGGSAPTLTSAASKMDLFTFVSDGTNWYGSTTQNYTP